MAWASEADLEAVFMEDLGTLGYSQHHGSEISPEMRNPMRTSFRETFLLPVFFEALKRLNPQLPDTAIQEAAARVHDVVFATDLVQENRRLHDLPVSYTHLTLPTILLV